jgi:hypothetical protein
MLEAESAIPTDYVDGFSGKSPGIALVTVGPI